jgi:hypothetical protein
MTDDEAVKAELPRTFFGEGFCPSSRDADPNRGSLETPLGCWSRAVPGPGYHEADELGGLEPESLAQRELGASGEGYGYGSNCEAVPAVPHWCTLSNNGMAVLRVRLYSGTHATHFGGLMPYSASHPKEDCLDSLVFDWSREHVANLFKGTEYSEFIEREGIDGYALAEIVARKEAFERLHPDWNFAKLCRLYKAITKFTRKSDNEVVFSFPLAKGRDGMSWFEARSSTFDRLSMSYGASEQVSCHVHELRGVKLVSVEWNNPKHEHHLRLTFRSNVLITHFVSPVPRLVGCSRGRNISSVPTVSRMFCNAVTKSFEYDLLKFSFTHEMAVLLPRSLRLAYRELLCIRKFCKGHPLRFFDKNLIAHLFKFVCSGFEKFCPVPFNSEELRYVARQREALRQVPPGSRHEQESTYDRQSRNKQDPWKLPEG